MSNFHALEVVGRGSETQLQVRENSFFTAVNPYTAERDYKYELERQDLQMFGLKLNKCE